MSPQARSEANFQARLLALHGFLGLPADWSEFSSELGSAIDARDLYLDVDKSFSQWATEFVETFPPRPLLVGYSMGGRLAMHAALRAPERFAGAIFISANPGLSNDADRAKRIAHDALWAKRFREEPWESVVEAWNAQPVLQSPGGGWPLERLEKHFSREKLARALEQWSLGEQRDLRAELSALRLPHLFLTGSEDAKFTAMTRELKLSPTGRHVVVEGAGHRLPWDQPGEFTAAVKSFAATLGLRS